MAKCPRLSPLLPHPASQYLLGVSELGAGGRKTGKSFPPAFPLKGCITDTWECGLSVALRKDRYKARDLGMGWGGSKATQVKQNQRPDPKHSDFFPSVASCDALSLWLGLTLTCGK